MTEAQRLAAEAHDLRQDGRLAEAEERYRAALAAADQRDWWTPEIHAEYGALLAQMHRPSEAALQFERSLQLELKAAKDEADPAVVKARYLLGEHYLGMGEAESARRVVAPSLQDAGRPLAWIVEAEALYLSGSVTAARAAGDRALALAADAAQRSRIRERLGPLWEGEGSGPDE